MAKDLGLAMEGFICTNRALESKWEHKSEWGLLLKQNFDRLCRNIEYIPSNLFSIVQPDGKATAL